MVCFWLSRDCLSQRACIADSDIAFVQQAAELSLTSEGLTYPHPNHGAVLVTEDGQLAGKTYQRAQGAPSAEQQLLREAGPAARGATIYLNLETGDCHGDTKALEMMLNSGVKRVVMGHRHPLAHMRGVAVSILRASGIEVQLLEAHPEAFTAGSIAYKALHTCLQANEVRTLLAAHCPFALCAMPRTCHSILHIHNEVTERSQSPPTGQR